MKDYKKNKENKMNIKDLKIIQKQIQRYGKIIDDYEKLIDGNYIRQKIYNYDNQFYIETWLNGKIILFNKF